MNRSDKRDGNAKMWPPPTIMASLLIAILAGVNGFASGAAHVDEHFEETSVFALARGDARRGARFYQTVCAVCHGFDGKAINFKDENKPEFIGTVASENPWETLHKFRNGQPGIGMPSLGALSLQDQVDILAYAQTLPAE